MRLSLIGMSGIGKSYWSQQLNEHGFKHFCCDTMIAQRLQFDLTNGANANRAMGSWMGFPYEAHYQESAAKYLGYEIEVVEEVLAYLENTPPGENVIIDTSGSVIYTGQARLERLFKQSHMVYLDTPASVQEEMRTAYLASPAPILWQDKFDQRPDESNEAALARCYPQLLASRTIAYKQWAEITLDYHRLRQPGFTVDDFLNEIRRKIPLKST